MTNLRRILYTDEYNPSSDLVKLLRSVGFSVDSLTDPENIERNFHKKNLKDYLAVIANSDYIYGNIDLIKANNPHLRFILVSPSSDGHEAVDRDENLRCGYNLEMIEKFINGELDSSRLPGNNPHHERQSYEHYG